MPHTRSTYTRDIEDRFQCRHIFLDGHRCQSPALRQENFCYYHHTTRKPVPKQELATRKSKRSTLQIPLPEDRSAIQHSIGQVLQLLAANQLDTKRAGLLLYGLQIASQNLSKPNPKAYPWPTVDDITEDGLAPIAEFREDNSPKGPAERMTDIWLAQAAEIATPGKATPSTDTSEILPQIQAAENSSRSRRRPRLRLTSRKERATADGQVDRKAFRASIENALTCGFEIQGRS